MARAKLLRQYLDDYNRKVTGANRDIEAANANYEAAFKNYQEGVDTFNAVAQRLQTNNVANLFPGDAIYQNGMLHYSLNNGSGLTQGSPAGTEISRAEAEQMMANGNDPGLGFFSGIWSRPTADGYPLYDYATGTELQPGTDAYNTELAKIQAEWDKEKRLADAGAVRYFNTAPGWVQKAYAAPSVPNAPVAPEPPKAPSLTQSDIRELENPGQDAAGIQMAANRGMIAKSELADNEKSKNSAFADPEDPNNLKDAGILARVIGGQL